MFFFVNFCKQRILYNNTLLSCTIQNVFAFLDMLMSVKVCEKQNSSKQEPGVVSYSGRGYVKSILISSSPLPKQNGCAVVHEAASRQEDYGKQRDVM